MGISKFPKNTMEVEAKGMTRGCCEEASVVIVVDCVWDAAVVAVGISLNVFDEYVTKAGAEADGFKINEVWGSDVTVTSVGDVIVVVVFIVLAVSVISPVVVSVNFVVINVADVGEVAVFPVLTLTTVLLSKFNILDGRVEALAFLHNNVHCVVDLGRRLFRDDEGVVWDSSGRMVSVLIFILTLDIFPLWWIKVWLSFRSLVTGFMSCSSSFICWKWWVRFFLFRGRDFKYS